MSASIFPVSRCAPRRAVGSSAHRHLPGRTVAARGPVRLEKRRSDFFTARPTKAILRRNCFTDPPGARSWPGAIPTSAKISPDYNHHCGAQRCGPRQALRVPVRNGDQKREKRGARGGGVFRPLMASIWPATALDAPDRNVDSNAIPIRVRPSGPPTGRARVASANTRRGGRSAAWTASSGIRVFTSPNTLPNGQEPTSDGFTWLRHSRRARRAAISSSTCSDTHRTRRPTNRLRTGRCAQLLGRGRPAARRARGATIGGQKKEKESPPPRRTRPRRRRQPSSSQIGTRRTRARGR